MIAVEVSDLKPGMILAKPVYNHQELLLLEAGARVTEKNIRMFKSWGVISVEVKGDVPQASGNPNDSGTETGKSIEIDLRAKFADVLNDPVMLEIMRAASRVLSKHLNERGEEK
jgi:hypothetical protein